PVTGSGILCERDRHLLTDSDTAASTGICRSEVEQKYPFPGCAVSHHMLPLRDRGGPTQKNRVADREGTQWVFPACWRAARSTRSSTRSSTTACGSDATCGSTRGALRT